MSTVLLAIHRTWIFGL